jgi:branched-chain amino acid transport system ATP-binding protein
MLLDVTNLSISFGGLKAVSDFSLHLEEGEMVGLIGPNGAGKTTIFNMLTGIYRPTEGNIRFDGEDFVGRKTHEFTLGGIARTFQNIRLFNNLTALDNIKIARHPKIRYGLASAFLRARPVARREDEVESECFALLERLGLGSYADVQARNLPYGVQRRLEIARALATGPKLLLLDEPAAGMNPQEVDALSANIRWIKKEFSVTILLIEHHMQLVMEICERLLVVNFGQTIAQGLPGEIKSNKLVVEAYLGKGGKF